MQIVIGTDATSAGFARQPSRKNKRLFCRRSKELHALVFELTVFVAIEDVVKSTFP
jgi:hypothetical protein